MNNRAALPIIVVLALAVGYLIGTRRQDEKRETVIRELVVRDRNQPAASPEPAVDGDNVLRRTERSVLIEDAKPAPRLWQRDEDARKAATGSDPKRLPETGPTLAETPPARDDVGFPKPLFVGNVRKTTPLFFEDPRTYGGSITLPRPERLVSRGKPVKSSAPDPIIGEFPMLDDGIKNGTDGTWIELVGGSQWVQIDLQSLHVIEAICVWHYFESPRVYRDVVVTVSEDADFKAPVIVFNNDADGSSGLGRGNDPYYLETHYGLVLDGINITGRYVRLYSAGNLDNGMNHYVEAEVYGARP